MAVRYCMTSSWITIILSALLRISFSSAIQLQNTTLDTIDQFGLPREHAINIAVMLECNSTCRDRFSSVIQESTVTNNHSNPNNNAIDVNVLHLTALASVSDNLASVCDVIRSYNVTLLVVVGRQDVINLQCIVTRQSALPVIAYATDNEKNTFKVLPPLGCCRSLIRCQSDY